MVHLDVGSPNDGVLRVTEALAERFRAKVIGIAACQPMQVIASDGYMAGDMVGVDLAEIAKETSEAEASFRTALQGKVADIAWRSVIVREQLSDYIVREMRAADLLVTGPDMGWTAFDSSRRVVVSDVVLQVGRPVLIVPHETVGLDLDVALVAWKDTREARRAIVDALPLLAMAGRVVVVEIAAANDVQEASKRVDDVARWLDRHGIASECSAAVAVGEDAAQLRAIAKDKRVGLVVAGAYGHNRLREWVMGGITRELLARPGCCSLVSH
jgi:nucleotide-binding universal stress UspA family protein